MDSCNVFLPELVYQEPVQITTLEVYPWSLELHALKHWQSNQTLIISTSWSTAFSPGNSGYKNYKTNRSDIRQLTIEKNLPCEDCWKVKIGKEGKTNLTQKKLSKNTTSWPDIYWGCIFCGTKNKFWSPIESGTYVWYVCFTFDLITHVKLWWIMEKIY